MARNQIPGPLERRHLLVKQVAEEKTLRTAEAYLDAGRAIEAVDFLAKAGAAEKLALLRSQAVREGDVFLLRSVAEADGTSPTRDEWTELAAAASELGKDSYAAEARRQADRGEN